jgi:hypothetical protein
MIADAGHGLPYDRSTQTGAAITAFLDDAAHSWNATAQNHSQWHWRTRQDSNL